jgi:VanZ family protein
MGFLSAPPPRRLAALLAAAGAAAILVLTLYSSPEQAAYAQVTPLLCLVCGDHGGADVFLNLLLFTPMATGLRLFGWSWRRVVLAAALLSLTVELLQYFVVTGRDASLSDLVTNTTGAAVAAGIAPLLGRLLAPDPRLAGRLFPAAIAMWLGVLALSALAVTPWAPVDQLRNDCTRRAGIPDAFVGTVRSVRLNGTLLPCDQSIPEGLPVAEALRRGEVTIEVKLLSGDPARGRAVAHALRDGGAMLLMLTQQGRSAAFSVPTAAQRLRLYSPILQLPLAFPPESGVPVTIRAGARHRRMWIASSHSGTARPRELALSPSYGWTAALAWAIDPRHVRIATAVWVGILILPAAYWAGFTRRPGWGAAGVVAALLAGLWLLPSATGFAPVHWSEWLGGCAGAVAGGALHRLAAYLQTRCGSPSTSAYSSS